MTQRTIMAEDLDTGKLETRLVARQTDRGQIFVTGPVSEEELTTWRMEDGLRSFRPPEQQKEALITITGMKHGQVFVARYEDTIIGYVTFHAPEEFERWSESSLNNIVELGAIEICPAWRNYGLGKSLLKVAFAEEVFEEYIVLATEYYWHWDLKGTDLNEWKYRDLMSRLMGTVDMIPMGTDDPEITSHPANMLMVKIGSKVTEDDIFEFNNLRYKYKRML